MIKLKEKTILAFHHNTRVHTSFHTNDLELGLKFCPDGQGVQSRVNIKQEK